MKKISDDKRGKIKFEFYYPHDDLRTAMVAEDIFWLILDNIDRLEDLHNKMKS